MRFIRPEDQGEEFLTAREAAEMCGVQPVTIRQWVFRGHLSAVAMLVGTCSHLYARRDVIACNRARTHGTAARGLRALLSVSASDMETP